MSDQVSQPAHYTKGKIQPLDFIVAQDLPYLAGNCVKYLTRYRWKGTPVQDLKKAAVYLQRLIAEEERKAGEPSS